MAKQLNVNLAFTANTSEAKQQIQSLQQQLTQLTNMPVSLKGQKLTQEIIQASNAAAELKIHLQNATNVQTGNLDFTKLNQSIKNSGSSLAEYGEKLKALGPAGNTAFQSLAQSVAKAEIPIRRSNTMLNNMWVTLKNTARWQLSSSVLHGFMSTVSSAYRYAQDLNESLNNIRIVTEQSSEQMARFAEQANKAAKSLSTTTTEYTNASLIYYQQGLSDEEVSKRTNITIKMANAAGVSAEKVSDQLTAVWNNFAKGGENLEYYADVMTALGAATASSTDEISEGLNKFASVAETVGLSYEYAASALATVTATTRQSADIVGTAFKTLFARIQDLELGKTLDDGTTLGTYSQALQKVGINIKDTSGEMKNMDSILEEMAAKWETLGQAEKTALAQSVAGVRQYTQLIALMDNWDFMQENLQTSRTASGTLDKQAEIYAESWEAAGKRVKTAAQAIYTDLLDDDFFIKLLDGFEKFLTLTDKIIDSMGGLKGVLAGVSAILLKTFSSQISQSLTNMAYNFQSMTVAGRKKIQNEQVSFVQSAAQSLNPTDENSTAESLARESSLQKQLQLQVGMIENADKMSAVEVSVNQMLMDRIRLIGEEVALRSQTLDLARQEVQQASLDARTEAISNAQLAAGSDDQLKAGLKGSQDYTKVAAQLKQEVAYEENINNQLNQIRQSGTVTSQSINDVIAVLRKLNDFSDDGILDGFIADLNETSQKLEGNSISAEDFEKQLRDISKVTRGVVKVTGEKKMSDIGVSDKNIKGVVDSYKKEAQAIAERNKVISEEQKLIDDLNNRIVNARGTQQKWSDTVVASAQHISSLTMGLTSLGNIVSTLQNPDMSGFEKMSSVIMSLSMGIPMLISGIAGLNGVLGISSAVQNAAAFSAQLYLNAHREELGTLTAEMVAQGAKISLDKAEIALSNAKALAKLKELNLTGLEIAEMGAKALAQKTGMSLDQAEIVVSKLKVGSTLAEATAEAGLTGVKMGGLAATIATTYAKGLESGARWANVVAIIAEYTAMSPLLVIVGLIAIALAALVGTVLLLVKGFQALQAASPEGKLKAAQEKAEGLKDALDDAKNAAEDLRTAFDNYNSVVDALGECVQGTTEWNNALKDVNNTVLELMANYPQLASMVNDDGEKAVTRDPTTGQLSIADWAMEQLQAEMDQTVSMLQMAVMSATQDVRAAEINVDKSNIHSQLKVSSLSASKMVETDSGLQPVDATDEAINLVMANLDKFAGASSDEEINSIVTNLLESAGFDANISNFVSAISDLMPEINSVVEAINNNTVATETENEIMASEALKNHEGFQDANNADQILKAAGDKYGELYKQELNNMPNRFGHKNDKNTWKDFLESANLQDKGYTLGEVEGSGINRKFNYKDAQGNEGSFTVDQMKSMIATTQAMEALGKEADNLIAVFSSLSEEGASFSAAAVAGTPEAMADFISKNLTSGEVEDLKADAEDGELTDESAQALGFENMAALTSTAESLDISVEELVASIFTAAEDISNSLTEVDEAALAGVNSDSATVWDKLTFSSRKQDAEEHLDSYDLAGTEQLSGLNEDNADNMAGLSKFYDGLAAIDLTAEDASQQVADLAEQYDVQGPTLDNLISSVEGLDKVYNVATDDINKQAATLQGIVGKEGLTAGDIISADDIAALEEAGINVDQYFTQMSDGTYSLTGKAEEFNNVVKKITLDGLKSQLEDFSKVEDQVMANYTDEAYQGKLRDTSSVQAGDKSGRGWQLTEYGAEQLGKARLDYIDSFEPNTFDFDDTQLELLEAYQNNPELELTSQQLATIADMMNVVNLTSVELEAQMFSTARSVAELNQIAANMSSELGSYSLNAYGEGLISIASQYDNCSTEVLELQEAMRQGDEEMIKTKLDALELSATIGELSKKYDLNAEDVETHAKLIQQNAKDMNLTAEQAANLAVANRRMNKGVETLNKNWKTWSKTLKTADKNSADYADTLNDANAALADLVGAVDAGAVPLDFLDAATESGAEHLEWMEKAAQGDTKAINLLGVALTGAQVELMEFNETMAQNAINSGYLDSAFNTDSFKTYKAEVMEGITALQTAIQDGTVSAGQNITSLMDGTGSSWVESLNAMAMATGMSVEQMNSMLNQLGVQAKVEVKDVEQEMSVPTYTEYSQVSQSDPGLKDDTGTWIRPPTWAKHTWTVPGPSKTVTGTVQVAQISTEDGDIGSPQVTYTGTGGGGIGGGISPSSTGGGGGGGGGGGKDSSPAEKVDVSKKSDFGERYHTVNKQLDNMSREMERASKAADKLWSRKRLKYLEEQNKQLDKEIELLQEKTRQAEEYLDQDKDELDTAAADLGFTISYGADGEILNYDAIRDGYAAQMIAAQEYMNSLSTKEEQDAYNKAVIEPLQKKIDAFEDAAGLYYNSLETIQDNADLIQEKLDQKLANNFEIWSGELELDIAINERDLELLEYYMSKIEDDVYQMAEAAALMVGSLDGLQSGTFGGQLGEYLSQLGTYQTALDDLNQKLANGEITEAAYEEGLEKIRAGLMDNLQSIQELDKAMLEYYSNTLDAVMEEMDKYTSKLEHQTSILEHYANMMEILGKSYDYKSMGVILEGQVKTIQNELEVAEAEYDLYKTEAENKRKLYEEAMKKGDLAAAEVYKKEWEAAEEAAMEAQSEMLDKTEQWAEAMRAVVENNLKDLAKTLEESLTGGTSFDQINTQLERAASLQEEYLTTTNKIYETNKLMRTAQQEIDKTTNLVAKQRLKDFIKETNQLQDKSKLSKYELEIQQAKYDLLLAQLALEDAQNAKSTVRLQRDSEGNFGYVYTADSNKLLEAQQQLEDAQNSLYNIGLEGANSYTEKYAQTMQEMYDTLTSISEAYFNGEIASQEEYEAQMLAAQQYYYEQLENYQDLYGIALQTDTRVIKDAWSTGMDIMTIETSDWKTAVQTYTTDATNALIGWYSKVEQIAQKTGLDNIANKVKTVTDESDKLKDKILGTESEPGVIDALAQELTAVSNLTGGYANLRQTLQGLINDYETLLQTVINAQNTETPIDPPDDDDPDETDPEDTDPEDTTPEDTTPEDTTPEEPSQPSLKKGDSVTVKTTATHFTRDGGNGTRMRSFVPGGTYTVMDYDDDEVMIGRGGKVTGWVKKTDLVGFDTGGYTGAWGSYGKLAVLDEKELVLNKGDTANFLASMELLEKILEMIDVQSASAQLGGLLSTPTYGGMNNSSTLEQSVHIEASFPSVTDRNEIEEAFNNLINTASQYANRK